MSFPYPSKIKHVHDTGAYQYADSVLSEKIPNGSAMVKACERFMKDLERDDIYMDLEDSRKIINYASLLNHYKGEKAGTPIILDPHQHFSFQQFFGWKRRETGLRRFTRSYKQIGRKQGKTTELAIQGIFHCHKDRADGPQFWVGATKEEQARICLTDAFKIIARSPSVKKHFKGYKNGKYYNTILLEDRNGIMSTIGRDSDKSDGLDVSFAGIDEYHAHPTTGIRDILASAQGNRLEPLESIITTAGFNINNPCYRVTRDVGLKILNGVIEDDEQLVIIYEIDDTEQWENEELWIHANPNIPYSTSMLPDLRSNFKRAKNEGGSTEVDFKTKRLNMWVNSPDVWITNELIKANNKGISEEELLGKECYGGLDLAKGLDLNAFVLFFPNVRENVHAVKCIFWIPDEKILLDKREADYGKWKQEGWIRTFEGNAVEPSGIAAQMMGEMEKYNVKSLGYDSKYFYSGPAEYLHNGGYSEHMIAVPQGFSLSGACRQIETWTAKKEMDLMTNPVLSWNFSNVVLKIGESGHIYPSKKASTNKIDGVSALVFAIYEYQRLGSEPPTPTPGVAGISWD